jgi:hypothetical protein
MKSVRFPNHGQHNQWNRANVMVAAINNIMPAIVAA